MILAIKEDFNLYDNLLKELSKLYIKTNGTKEITFKICIIIMIKISNQEEFIPKAKELKETISKDIFSDIIFTKEKLSILFYSSLDNDIDKNIFVNDTEGVSLNIYKSKRGEITKKINEITPKKLEQIFSMLCMDYDDKYKSILSTNLKAIRRIFNNKALLPYTSSYFFYYFIEMKINDKWDDLDIKEITYLGVEGELRTKEYNIIKTAFDNINLFGSTYKLSELKVISFKPKKECSKCKVIIGENIYIN